MCAMQVPKISQPESKSIQDAKASELLESLEHQHYEGEQLEPAFVFELARRAVLAESPTVFSADNTF